MNRFTYRSFVYLIQKLTPITFIFFFLISILKGQNIYINEFQASNTFIEDEYGEADDWVELYNAGNAPINIGGMYVTDDLDDLTSWQIPATDPSLTTIPAQGFLILWFDKNPEQGVLHVDTKLSGSGEDIGLIATDGLTIIDSYTYGEQTANISEGRSSDGADDWTFFSEESPGETNANGNNFLMVDMPITSVAGGHHTSQISVVLSTTTPDATIRYTTDGSEPVETSTLYSSPVTINETTPLRARAFKPNLTPSRTSTNTYLFGVTHTFPIICLNTAPENFFDTLSGIYGNWMEDLEQPVHAELFELDGTLGFKQDLGIKIHGGGSAAHTQKGLDLIARTEYGEKYINYKVFPDLKYDKYRAFILRASGNDSKNTLFRDAMISDLVRNVDDVEGRIKKVKFDPQAYRPCIVYLNGNYFGIHNMREKMDYRYLERRHGIDKDEVDLLQSRIDINNGNLDAWKDFFEFVDENDFDNEENMDSLRTMLDVDEYLDYNVFNIFIDNNDWPANNNKHWRERKEGKKWHWMTYDLDFAFGLGPLPPLPWNSGEWSSNTLRAVLTDTATTSAYKPWATLFMRKLMQNEAVRTQFVNRMADQLNIYYGSDRILQRINQFENLYAPEIEQHQTVFEPRPWNVYLERISKFAANRDTFVWSMFKNEFADITDVVDLNLQTNPTNAGSIHLNTIRLNENQTPWSGQYFAGVDVPLSAIPGPGYIFDSWSNTALGNDENTSINLSGDETITANFVLGSTAIGNIVINEINYNSPDENNAGDWIELYNAGTSDIDLSAWYFEDESNEFFAIPVGTILPADGYLVLVEDSTDFQTVYPTVTNFIGNFGQSISGSFKLNNDSEFIKISNADASFTDSLTYADESPWPEAADGTGFTLQLISAELDNTLAASWVAVDPTPGVQNLGNNQVAGASSGLPITYAIESGPATMAGNVVTLDGVIGVVVVKASQAGNLQYNEAPDAFQSFTVIKKQQTISFPQLSDKLTNDLPFGINASSTSGLAINFTIISGPASINGNLITLDGIPGTVVVRASQSGNQHYNPAPIVDQSFEVTSPNLNQTINFPALSDKLTTDAPFTLLATASSGLPVNFEMISGPATIAGDIMTLDGIEGMVTIRATQIGDGTYNTSVPVERYFFVNKANQILSFQNIPDKLTTDLPFNISASSSAGLAISFEIISGPATINGDLITLDGIVGTVIVRASQAGNGQYAAASPVQKSFLVTSPTGLIQSISFPALEDKMTTDLPFTISAIASSALPVSFEILSGPATINGNEITLDGVVGTVTVRASQAGNGQYAVAPNVDRSFEVTSDMELTQSIDFAALSDKTTADLPFNISATASSNLPVSFEIISGPATIMGNEITLDGVEGIVVVRASQAGNTEYAAAPNVDRSFEVVASALQTQVIEFPTITDKWTTDPPFELNVTTNANLPVTLSVEGGPATVEGNTITLLGIEGTVVIRAVQQGNGEYNAADDVFRTFLVKKVGQTITFPAIGNKFIDDEPFDIEASSSSGLPVVFEIVSGPASILGNTITLTGEEGTVVVRAIQEGAGQYEEVILEQSFQVLEHSIAYCESSGSFSDKEFIKRIIFAGIDHTSGQEGYGDFRDQTARVRTNQEYNLRIYPGFEGYQHLQFFHIWIDFNQDGDFEDQGEEVFSHFRPDKPASSAIEPINRSIRIPDFIPSGTTRMRVSMQREMFPESCEFFEFGEVEDYSVLINETAGESFEGLGIYPNPAQSYIFIDMRNARTDVGTMYLYNAMGQIVYKQDLDVIGQGTLRLDIDHLDMGGYIADLILSDGSRLTKQFVIVR